ncbi:MAG TPA: carbohydrate ABC transporter permease [Euzebyales bacterium]|nr:carbohydrate ABC transporter permease [Euzebyales bacterium]
MTAITGTQRATAAAAPLTAPRRTRVRVARWLLLAALLLLLVFLLFPFALVAVNAVKSPADYATNGPLALPEAMYLNGVREFWTRVDFTQKLLNSLMISGTVAVAGVALSLLNAYAIGIGRVRGRLWVLVFFLTANMLPHEALAYPLYYVAKAVGLYDTRLSVTLIFIVIQSAFGTYLLSSVFGSFPREILEAAEVDGAGKLATLVRIVVPISWPTLSMLFTLFFIWTWNEFFLPLIFLISNDNQTVPVALGVLQGQRLMDATMSSASALLGIVPAVVFFLIFQRTLTKGITAGAVK